MDYDGRVVFKIDGDDSGLKKAVNGAESSLSGLKSTIVKLGLGALLTKGMKDAVQATNGFESALAKASTLFGSVAVDTENLSQKILELSTVTGQTAQSIGNSLYNALSAGVPVTEDMGDAMMFLESATKLSVAGFTDVDTAVTATAKVMNAYGMSMEDVGRIGEILMETQNLGITTVNELGSALATVTPLAASFGVSFEQIGASLALMTKKGTDTATATTQLRGLIQELGQDGTQASKNLQKAFARAGLEYKNFAEYMKDPENNLQTAIELLAEEAEVSGLSLSDMFSNVRAGVGALQLATDEMGVFNTFMEDMAGDSQLVEDAYNKMMDTRTNKWKRMREQLKNITIKITESEGIQEILDNITDLAQKLINKFDGMAVGFSHAIQKMMLAGSLLKTWFDKTINDVKLEFGIDLTGDWETFKEMLANGNFMDIFKAGSKVVTDTLSIVVGVARTAWDDFSKALDEFFGVNENGNFAQKTLDFIIKIVDNELEDLADKLKNGDLFGALMEIGKDYLTLKIGLHLVESTLELLKSSLIFGFGGIGISGSELGLLALSVGLSIHDAMESGNWESLGSQIVSGLTAMMIAYGFTKNTSASVLAFSIGLSLDFMNGDNIKKTVRDLAKNFAFIQDFLNGGNSKHILERQFLMEDYDFLSGLSTRSVDEIMAIMEELDISVEEAFAEYNRRLTDYGEQLGINVDEALENGTTQFAESLENQLGKTILDFQQFSELLGIAVSQGLIDGIQEGWEMEDYLDVFRQLPEDVKELYDIHSPSRVFEGIGENILAGFTAGATDEQMMNLLEQQYKDFGERLSQALLEGADPVDIISRYMEGNAVFDEWTKFIRSGEGQNYKTDQRWINMTEYYKKLMANGGVNKIDAPYTSSSSPVMQSATAPWVDGFEAFIKELSDSENIINNWKETFSSAFNSIGQGFESLGEALVTGESGFNAFAKAGLDAIASVLEGLAEQMIAMAVTATNWGEKALYLAGASAAMVSAGVVRGLGNKFNGYEYGGIVGGHGITGDRHMVFANAGELILSRAQQGAIASQLGNQSQPTIHISFNGQVFGDQQTISEYVYEGIRTAQNNGVLQAW